MLGTKGEEFLRWGIEELAARANHGYDAGDNSFWATLIDGTRLTPADRKREGYVLERWLKKRPADGRHFLAYSLAYKLSRKKQMWEMAGSIARGLGLGDRLPAPGTVPRLLAHRGSTAEQCDPGRRQ